MELSKPSMPMQLQMSNSSQGAICWMSRSDDGKWKIEGGWSGLFKIRTQAKRRLTLRPAFLSLIRRKVERFRVDVIAIDVDTFSW